MKCFASSVTITFFWSLSSFSPILHISLRAALLRGAFPRHAFVVLPKKAHGQRCTSGPGCPASQPARIAPSQSGPMCGGPGRRQGARAHLPSHWQPPGRGSRSGSHTSVSVTSGEPVLCGGGASPLNSHLARDLFSFWSAAPARCPAGLLEEACG